MHQAYKLTVSGEKIPVEPANGSDFQLDELKDAIGGGYIEVVPIDDQRIMVVDEEGKLKKMPYNARATALYPRLADIIVGDALVCDRSQIK